MKFNATALAVAIATLLLFTPTSAADDSADPVAIQLEVLAGALRAHAPELIEARFLPPAVRALLQRE